MDDAHPDSHAHAARTGPDGDGKLSDYPPALIEATLERVKASDTFRRSQRHRHFLEHVIRAGLANRRDRLKEVIIGIEVFGRALPAYDPRRDPIVRVEARRIRDKLARFYQGEGAGESFQIVIPIGGYMPQFVRRTRRSPTTRPKPSQSLAVLPFANLSGDPDDASFALGLADQLIDTIGRVPGLKVVARLSALKARDAGMDLKAIGRLLAVDHVVDGSVQRSGGRLRSIAHLSRTRDGMRVWSQRFEHDTEADDDLFDHQDAIGDAVLGAVSALRSPASPGDWSGLRAHVTGDRGARDLFERARLFSQQRTYDGYRKAIDLLERAIALDPGFPQAHSQLGAAYANRLGFNMEPSYPAFDHVERAARRALELDPLDGEARVLLATIAFRLRHSWGDAEPLFHDALRMSPNSTLVHSAFAWALVFVGRFDDAMAHARVAQSLDPLNLGLRANNAAIAMHAQRFEVALHEFAAVLQLEPAHWFSRLVGGVTHLAIGQLDAATDQFDRAARAVPDHFTPRFCQVCALGLRGRADREAAGRGAADLATLLDDIGTRHYSRVNLAMAQVCLGRIDDAFASLEAAADARDLLFVGIRVHPLFAPLRDDSRYPGFLARRGLAPLPVAVFEREPRG